jgi:hypothetical protein
LIDVLDFIHSPLDVDAFHPGHFNRMVYFRLYEHLSAIVQSRVADKQIEKMAATAA